MENYFKLQKLHVNIKKSINAKLKEETLKEKLRDAHEWYKNIFNYINETTDPISEDQFNQITTNTNTWHQEVTRILKIKIDLISRKACGKNALSLHYPLKVAKVKSSKMVPPVENTPPFDIKQATAIVQPYDGSADNLGSFIDAAALLNEYVQPAHVATAIKFLRTRLIGKARIGLQDNFNTIQQLIDDVQQRCRDKTTPESIIAQMRALKVKPNENMKDYCDGIEKCCANLKSIYVNQKMPAELADSMARKAGIDALITGISNPEIKLILKAGTFSSLAEAITKINENSSQDPARGAQVLTISRPRGQMSRGGHSARGNRGGHKQNYNRNGYQNNGYNNHGSYNNYRSRNNQGNNFQGFNQGNNFQSFGNSFRGRRGNNRNVYNIQSGQPQPGVNQLQQMLPALAVGPGMQQSPQFVYPQPQNNTVQQPNFFGQIQRG